MLRSVMLAVAMLAFAGLAMTPRAMAAQPSPVQLKDCGTVFIVKPVYFPLKVYVADDKTTRTSGPLITTYKTAQYWVAASDSCDYFHALKRGESSVLYRTTDRRHTEPIEAGMPNTKVFLTPTVLAVTVPCQVVTAVGEYLDCVPKT